MRLHIQIIRLWKRAADREVGNRRIVLVQLALEHRIHLPHRQLLILLMKGDQIVLPKTGATPHSPHTPPLFVRNVHRKSLCQNVEMVPHGTQVLHQLNLVVTIVHETLVEQRRLRRSLEENVPTLTTSQKTPRFLEIREHACDARHVNRTRKSVPFR